MQYKALVLVPSAVKNSQAGYLNIGDYLQAVLTERILSSNDMVDEVKVITLDPIFDVLEMYFKNDTGDNVHFQYREHFFYFPLSELRKDPVLINSVSCNTSSPQNLDFFIDQINNLDANGNTTLLIFIYDHETRRKREGPIPFNEVFKALDSKKLCRVFIFADSNHSGLLANYIEAIDVSIHLTNRNEGKLKLLTELAFEASKYNIPKFPQFFNLLSRINVAELSRINVSELINPSTNYLKAAKQPTIRELKKVLNYKSFKHLADTDYEIEKAILEFCEDSNDKRLAISRKLAKIGVTKVSQLRSFIEFCKRFGVKEKKEINELFRIINCNIDTTNHIQDIIKKCKEYDVYPPRFADYFDQLLKLRSSEGMSLLERFNPTNLDVAAICSCKEEELSDMYKPMLVNQNHICLGSYAGEEFIAALQYCYAAGCAFFDDLTDNVIEKTEFIKREFGLSQECVCSSTDLSDELSVFKFRDLSNKAKKRIPASFVKMLKRFGFLEYKVDPSFITADGNIDRPGSDGKNYEEEEEEYEEEEEEEEEEKNKFSGYLRGGVSKTTYEVIYPDHPTPPKNDEEEHADQRITYVECSKYQEYLEKIALWAEGESVGRREIPIPPACMREKPPKKDCSNLGRSSVMLLYFYLNDELKNRDLPLFHPEDPEEYENDPNGDDYYDEFLKYTHHIDGDFFFIKFFMNTDNKLATFLHIISSRAGNPKLGEEIFLKAWERYKPLYKLIPWQFNSLN